MATGVKRSGLNPFRTPTMTPNPTGVGPAPSSSQPQPQLLPQLHSRLATPSASAPRERSPPRQERSTDDLAAELQTTTLEDNMLSEPPPAYTPSANPYEGEATVEYGPHRPFQPAPPAPPLPQQFTGMSILQQPHFTGMPPQGSPFLTPQPTGFPTRPNQTGGWSQNVGHGALSSSSFGRFGPPPRHPSVTRNGPAPSPQINGMPAPTGMSDFARDFYASTPSNRRPSPVPSNGSSGEIAEPEHYERTGPPSTTPALVTPRDGPLPSRYVPPNGPPPSSISSSYAPPNGPPPSLMSSSSYAPSNGPRPSGASSGSDEGWRPTTTPTPGQPLLNKGRVLVYPPGVSCQKCLNTGYKSFDASHPCRKCWEKYAKPYSGALMYAPHSQQSQRPLPALKPPHLRHQQTHSSTLLSPPLASNLVRSQSAYRPNSGPNQGYPGRAVSNPCLGGLAVPHRPMAMPKPQLSFPRGMPPPGSMVVRPGDARIGGRVCWKCDGTGSISFLIFDIEQCPVCKGVGRILQ